MMSCQSWMMKYFTKVCNRSNLALPFDQSVNPVSFSMISSHDVMLKLDDEIFYKSLNQSNLALPFDQSVNPVSFSMISSHDLIA
ncbi:orf14 [Sucra jujuba nucleopolyhedrovirus]|uniref:Orf14 n=1 Tax=Sucra jujuba nucleopolyhedrovirus TaxID=1563660 RepID=A0A097P8V1_9ABAC|nr:orf14 [Sucra jujuba nucleopolyhedrovirus]AIU41253.1 orf14 [Sucra jujuba nucleopolyhedrovirus]